MGKLRISSVTSQFFIFGLSKTKPSAKSVFNLLRIMKIKFH